MMNQFLFSFSLLLLLLFQCTATLAESSAQDPTPPGPTNITEILGKAGRFTTFSRLLRLTQDGDQIDTQLNNSNLGLTVFAPSDNAFLNLKPGTLNSLTDQQENQLVQFHILPTYIAMTQFETVSNPLRTQAGDSDKFMLNVTNSGYIVNISTGVVNASVANTVYTDDQLAVYEVDKVLLPLGIFASRAPLLAPTPAPSELKTKKSPAPSSATVPDDASGGTVSLAVHDIVVSIGVAVGAAFYL